MQLLSHQQNVDVLYRLVSTGIDLLVSRDFETLVKLYGYAMAFERDPVGAVKFDLDRALSGASGSELMPVIPGDVSVIFYRENTSGLRAAIDCKVPLEVAAVSGSISSLPELPRRIFSHWKMSSPKNGWTNKGGGAPSFMHFDAIVMLIVHEGRGGYVEFAGRRFIIEHIERGDFCIHLPRATLDPMVIASLKEFAALQDPAWYVDAPLDVDRF